MDDFDRQYLDMLYRRDYPLPPPPDEVEKPAAEKGSRQRAQENAPSVGDAGMGLLNMLAGALKGATAQTLGLPGDLESLVRMLAGGQNVLPTTEDMQKKLPPVVPGGSREASAAETLGEFFPVAPIGAAKAGVKAVKSGVKALAK